jgi:hypothetical protein
MEIHHIKYRSDNGSDDQSNLIPLCFDCHAEVNHYNTEHPKGRKFSAPELKLHRKQWLDICKNSPEIFSSSNVSKDAGALQGLLEEIRINLEICKRTSLGRANAEIGFPLYQKQYLRALEEGIISLLSEKLVQSLTDAYLDVKLANACIENIKNARDQITEEGNSDKHFRTLNILCPKLEELYSDLYNYLHKSDTKGTVNTENTKEQI